jgi:hypothetical protein
VDHQPVLSISTCLVIVYYSAAARDDVTDYNYAVVNFFVGSYGLSDRLYFQVHKFARATPENKIKKNWTFVLLWLIQCAQRPNVSAHKPPHLNVDESIFSSARQ